MGLGAASKEFHGDAGEEFVAAAGKDVLVETGDGVADDGGIVGVAEDGQISTEDFFHVLDEDGEVLEGERDAGFVVDAIDELLLEIVDVLGAEEGAVE